jgi:hypothetical protein
MLMVLRSQRLVIGAALSWMAAVSVSAAAKTQPAPAATCIPATTEGVGRFIAQIRGVLVNQAGQSTRQRNGLQAISVNEIAVTTDSVICRRVRALDLAAVQANNSGQPPDSVFGRTFLVAKAGPYWAYRMHRSINDPRVEGISIANDSLTRVIVRFR